MSTELRRIGGLGLRALLSAVLAYAGVQKALEPTAFVEQVANYQWFPQSALLVAAFLPTTELVTALSLWLPSAGWRRAAALLATGLFAVFTVAVARAYLVGIDVDCGCFGEGSGQIGPLTVLRNGALTAGGALLLWFSRPKMQAVT